jgi:hypothetical protein
VGECTARLAVLGGAHRDVFACSQETYGATQMRQHVVYVSVGSEQRQVGLSACSCAVRASASRASCL